MKNSRKNIKKNKRNSSKFKISGGGLKLYFFYKNGVSESFIPLIVEKIDTILSIKLKLIDIFKLKDEDSSNIYKLTYNNNGVEIELSDSNNITDYRISEDDILTFSQQIPDIKITEAHSEHEHNRDKFNEDLNNIFKVNDVCRIKKCVYLNELKYLKYVGQIVTILFKYSDPKLGTICVLRFHDSDSGIGIGDNDPRFGPNTIRIPIECLEEYHLEKDIIPVVGDYAIIDFDLDKCLYKSLKKDYNYAAGKILHIYIENSIKMCIYKFLNSELGYYSPKFGHNTAEIPLNCLEVYPTQHDSFQASISTDGDSSTKSFEASSSETTSVEDFTQEARRSPKKPQMLSRNFTNIFKIGNFCTIKKCDYRNEYEGEIGSILSFYSDRKLGKMCVFHFLNPKLGHLSSRFGDNTEKIPLSCLSLNNYYYDKFENSKFKIGNRVIFSSGLAHGPTKIPVGSIGTVVDMRIRYRNSSAEYILYKVIFDDLSVVESFSNEFFDYSLTLY